MAKKKAAAKKTPKTSKSPKSLKPSYTKKPQPKRQKQIPGILVEERKNPANRKKLLGDYTDLEAELLSGKLLSVRRPVGGVPKLKTLPDAIYTRFLQYIMLGCYDHVAAASVGITPMTFYNWKRRGEGSRKGIFRRFYLDVLQAQGVARQIAEQQVKTKEALAWLKSGPGRSTEDAPGWTETPTVLREGDTFNFQQNIDSSPERRLGVIGAMAELQKLGYLQVTEQGQGLLGVPAADEITDDDILDEGTSDNGNGHASNGKAG